jgi:hypothetical protein
MRLPTFTPRGRSPPRANYRRRRTRRDAVGEADTEGLTSEDERSQLQRVFDSRLIWPGSAEPGLDAREAARGVAEFYRFPGWS